MKKVSHFYLGFVFLILYLPIFYLIFYAFNKGGDMNAFTGFTLEHFNELFADSRLMLILSETFLLAFLSALIATVIGTFGAIYIYQSKKKLEGLSVLSISTSLVRNTKKPFYHSIISSWLHLTL